MPKKLTEEELGEIRRVAPYYSIGSSRLLEHIEALEEENQALAAIVQAERATAIHWEFHCDNVKWLWTSDLNELEIEAEIAQAEREAAEYWEGKWQTLRDELIEKGLAVVHP